jgi:hypothetical protein
MLILHLLLLHLSLINNVLLRDFFMDFQPLSARREGTVGFWSCFDDFVLRCGFGGFDAGKTNGGQEGVDRGGDMASGGAGELGGLLRVEDSGRLGGGDGLLAGEEWWFGDG